VNVQRAASANRAAAVILVMLLCTAVPTDGQTPPARRGFEVHEATISDLQRAMTDGVVSSLDLVNAYLARIAAYDQRGPALNAMIRLSPTARADARRLDEERRQGKVRGPLHGIPIILKDNFDTADLPTSGGSLALVNHQTSGDAFVVRKLREAGAVILGKSNLHELAAGITTISSLGGQTRNPYDPRRCPGGSSGGTGAAIAASFAAIGWGSDTCGSIRIPAAFGSLVGLRPTQGLVSRSGVMPLSHTQDIAGPLARTVADLAIALDATIGADPADAATKVLEGRALPRFTDSLSAGAIKGTRIGILANYFTDADGEVLDTIRAAIRAMVAAGADTITVNIAGFDSLLAGTSVINYEHKFDMIDYLARTPAAPAKSIADILAAGYEADALEARFRLADSLGTRDSEAYRRALVRQGAARARVLAVMDSLRVDVLAYPTMRRKPVLAGEPQLGSSCALAAQTGLPALSAPAGFTSDGLPAGIELLGRPFSDARLVSIAYAWEKLGARRRAPFTTPPLVNARAPLPVSFATTTRAGTATARVQFVYDAIRASLRYDATVSGSPATSVQALVLRRVDPSGRGRVIHRLLGPGVVRGAGTITLAALDRAALEHDGIVMSLITSGRPATEARLVPRTPLIRPSP
jgi:Asp-tRNA(Asn)/Glu-tRNA(Gln) amidotransferase A subunit family amidase